MHIFIKPLLFLIDSRISIEKKNLLRNFFGVVNYIK